MTAILSRADLQGPLSKPFDWVYETYQRDMRESAWYETTHKLSIVASFYCSKLDA